MAQLCKGAVGAQLPRMSVGVMRIRLQRLAHLIKKTPLVWSHAIQPGFIYSCSVISLFLGIAPGGCSSMS